MNIDIPQRAKNEQDFPQLKVLDKRIIAYAVLCQVGNEEAFMRFHPEYLRADGKGMNEAGKTESKHFWSYGKNREYRQTYEATLEEFFGRRQTNRASADEPITDKRKDEALKSLFDKAMTLVEGQGDLDADTLKIAAEIFKKIGLLKDDVDVQEAPRRYLPERCSSCLYRSFVESHVETGEIENACLRCRALKMAKNNGFRYDEKDLLEPIKNENTNGTTD